MSNHTTTLAFFAATDASAKTQIVRAVASHYGCSEAQAFDEITDPDAEHLLDYLTGTVRTAAHILMQRHGLA